MARNFKRKIEDFVCDNCNTLIKGNGYTDHCSFCLYSKHVDINPGDRSSNCKGIMEPVAAEVKDKGYRIYYKCLECSYTHRVKSDSKDNLDVISYLLSNPIRNEQKLN